MDEKVCKIKFTPQCKKDSVCIYLPLQDVRVKRWLTALPKLPATFRQKKNTKTKDINQILYLRNIK